MGEPVAELTARFFEAVGSCTGLPGRFLDSIIVADGEQMVERVSEHGVELNSAACFLSTPPSSDGGGRRPCIQLARTYLSAPGRASIDQSLPVCEPTYARWKLAVHFLRGLVVPLVRDLVVLLPYVTLGDLELFPRR